MGYDGSLRDRPNSLCSVFTPITVHQLKTISTSGFLDTFERCRPYRRSLGISCGSNTIKRLAKLLFAPKSGFELKAISTSSFPPSEQTM
eukprot:g15236.t1